MNPSHDCLLVFATDVLVIDPAHLKILETTVKMFDITHHLRHFKASLEQQLRPIRLYLQPCSFGREMKAIQRVQRRFVWHITPPPILIPPLTATLTH